jgi:hypothetical protein
MTSGAKTMDYVIWGGAALSMIGILGLVWCIVLALRAKRSGLPDDQIKARLQQVVALNLGALAISALGLMMVIAGIILA